MVKTIIPRDWQNKSMENWIDNGYKGIDIVPTGNGKTISAIQKILKLRKNTLIVVKTEVLMKQWYDEIKEFVDIDEDKIGFFYGSKKEIKNITIGIINSLSKSDIDFTEHFSMCVYDEIHNYSSDTFVTFLENNNFQYKIGLTATLKRQDGGHNYLLELLGGVNYRLDEKTSKEDGYMNRFSFIDYSIGLDEEDRLDYDMMETKLKGYMERMNDMAGENINPFEQIPNENKAIGMIKMHYRKEFMKQKKFMFTHYLKNKHCIKLIQENQDKKIIIFNEFNEMALSLFDILEHKGMKPLLLNTTTKKKQKEILEKYSSSDYNILIATKMIDEGYNLPQIDMGIIVAGSSGERQIKQRVGRVIRKKEKPSVIYQLFLRETRDEKYAEKRKSYIDYADEYDTIYV